MALWRGSPDGRRGNIYAGGYFDVLHQRPKPEGEAGEGIRKAMEVEKSPKIIAGLYEIQQKIGSGGGGIVYLGYHLRLDMRVVLKADKRKLSVGEAVLKREVNLLKGLSHTYIPHVYDFIEEDGVVYTVMDYIEGESLDKLLSSGRHPDQAQVIRWACQLLEALKYLHGQPPYGILHGDIKPANIMLRPSGDVCLIDYNIALALGEDGAVKVGMSRGYASPEHYGSDYIRENRSAAVRQGGKGGGLDSEKTEAGEEPTATEPAGTVTEPDFPSAGAGGQGPSTDSSKGVLLDVRSDIYSLGATLYHLLSGKRPAQDARDVEPLTEENCSPAVASIIQKSMSPLPEKRYQTAEEMLDAFRLLHVRDPRAVRLKRQMRSAAVFLACMFLAGGACLFIGMKQQEKRQEALVLAEYSANALAEGDVSLAVTYALQAIPKKEGLLEAPVTAEAQKALTDALGVYDLSDGFKDMDSLKLPSAPFGFALSPGGSRIVVRYAYEAAVYEMETREKLSVLPLKESAMADAFFLNEDTVVCAGLEGVTAYDTMEGKTLWTGGSGTTLAVSADGEIVAAVDRSEDHAVVYRASDGEILEECSFGDKRMFSLTNDNFADPEMDIFALNRDGSLLAVSFEDGGLCIYNLEHPEESLIVYEASGYSSFSGGFCGKYFAFAGNQGGEAAFGLIDLEKGEYIGEHKSQNALRVLADESGIYLADGSLLVRVDPETMENVELAYADSRMISGFSVSADYVLVTVVDGGFTFFDSGAHPASGEDMKRYDFTALSECFAVLGSRDVPSIRLMEFQTCEEAQFLSYDARFPHDEARVSADGRTVMLFNIDQFRIYSVDGELLAQTELPDAASIYDQQFRKAEDGSYLEVFWYDGTVRRYSAGDGSLVLEEKGEVPGEDLHEEFETERYRIVSELHTAPEVYDKKSGELVTTLEEDCYLTYVTELDDMLLTEYISTDGGRFGLLLNEKLETLAYLPNLCDIADDMLVFDYESGNLRQCRLYSLPELVALGEAID